LTLSPIAAVTLITAYGAKKICDLAPRARQFQSIQCTLMSIRWGRQDKQRTPTTPIFISCPQGSNRACHLLFYDLLPLYGERPSSQRPSLSCPWGGLYEGYLDDTFGECFCPLLINRITFGSQHSGLHEFDVGQRPAKSLGSWTPFRLQKIGLRRGSSHSSFSLLLLGSATRISYTPSILPFFGFILDSFFLFSIRFCFRRCLSPRCRLRSGKIVKIVGVILYAPGSTQIYILSITSGANGK
jgi:hypothetical protein